MRAGSGMTAITTQSMRGAAAVPVEAAPLFSVVVPACGRVRALADCLEQLAPGGQSLPATEFEVIVSDDSPMKPVEAALNDRFPWVRWTKGPRRGPAANRNWGAEQARGKWLVFTDDDCVPDPTWLAEFQAALDVTPGARVLEGRTIAGVAVGALQQSPENPNGGYLWSCNMLVERALFESMGGFDERFPHAHLEDVDFRMRLEKSGEPYAFVPAALVLHPPRPLPSVSRLARMHESSFHLARKHGLPLAEAGFSFAALVRARCASFRTAIAPWSALQLACRMIGEVALIVLHLPGWYWKYRSRPPA